MSDSPIQKIDWQGKTAVIYVTGDVDLHRSTELQNELMEVLGKKPDTVIVDLSGVPYMDSSGVASLVKLLSRTRKGGIELKLVAPTVKVRSILEITRLDSVFTIADSLDEAL